MPRAKSDAAKSSTELDAEIEEMQKKLAEKRKAAQAAKRKERAEAEQARAIEEAEFNRDFVEAAKEIYLSDYEDSRQTVYELVRSIIRSPAGPEPVQATGESVRQADPMQGVLLRQSGAPTA